MVYHRYMSKGHALNKIKTSKDFAIAIITSTDGFLSPLTKWSSVFWGTPILRAKAETLEFPWSCLILFKKSTIKKISIWACLYRPNGLYYPPFRTKVYWHCTKRHEDGQTIWIFDCDAGACSEKEKSAKAERVRSFGRSAGAAGKPLKKTGRRKQPCISSNPNGLPDRQELNCY